MNTFPLRSLFAPLKELMDALAGICCWDLWLFHFFLRFDDDVDGAVDAAVIDLISLVRSDTTMPSGLVLPILIGFRYLHGSDITIRIIMVIVASTRILLLKIMIPFEIRIVSFGRLFYVGRLYCW